MSPKGFSSEPPNNSTQPRYHKAPRFELPVMEGSEEIRQVKPTALVTPV